MPWFQFVIHGENYKLPSEDGSLRLAGFYTTRNFKAKTYKSAEFQAFHSIRNDIYLNRFIDEGIEPKPTIKIESYMIYDAGQRPEERGQWPFRTREWKGFTFYSDPELHEDYKE